MTTVDNHKQPQEQGNVRKPETGDAFKLNL